MWDLVICRFTPSKPGREHCALAHPRTTGHYDPAIDAVGDQQLVEPGKKTLTAHEPGVSLPLDREVDHVRRHGLRAYWLSTRLQGAPLVTLPVAAPIPVNHG